MESKIGVVFVFLLFVGKKRAGTGYSGKRSWKGAVFGKAHKKKEIELNSWA